MEPAIDLPAETKTFLRRLDEAVAREDRHAICEHVKATLIEMIDAVDFPDHFFEESPNGYARRLLHRCPEHTYSVMVMVWGPGQGTPVHDHAGKWCVECVHRGTISITGYHPTSDLSQDIVQFEELDTTVAHRGDVGILVPPNEYHRIRNVADETAVTIHVYAGEMLWCHAFHPLDSREGFRKERLTLKYTG